MAGPHESRSAKSNNWEEQKQLSHRDSDFNRTHAPVWCVALDTRGHCKKPLFFPFTVLCEYCSSTSHLTLGKNWSPSLNIHEDTDSLSPFETCVLFLCLVLGAWNAISAWEIPQHCRLSEAFLAFLKQSLLCLHFSRSSLYGIHWW